MALSIPPPDDTDASVSEGSYEITDNELDRWIENGDKPVLCSALIQRMQAAARTALNENATTYMPKEVLHLYEITVDLTDNPIEGFRKYCQKYGVNGEFCIDFHAKNANGKLEEKIRNFMHLTLEILSQRLNIDPNALERAGKGIYMVGGSSQKLAEALATQIVAKLER